MEAVDIQRFGATESLELCRHAAYVGGSWLEAEQSFDVLNPADGTKIASLPLLGAAETRLAIDAACRAQDSWARMTGKERGDILRRWSLLMRENADALGRLLTAEQGKPLAEAIAEVSYAASFLEWFAEEARRINGALLSPHAVDRRLIVRKEPVGVVAAITPWNFPMAMVTRKAGPALAAGCTFILKPSEQTPLSALALARLAEISGIPAGVFNVVTGPAREIGEVLTSDKRIRKFSFTGSTAVGKMLAAKCAQTVKRVSLELGGNAPFIVFDDADLDAAVEGAIASKFRNTGQTCVCANRFLVQSGIYDAFAEKLTQRVQALITGPGLAGATDQGPLIDERAANKVALHVADAVAKGAQILTGGARLEGEIFKRGTFYAPTVIRDVPKDALLCSEETFGPVAGLIRFETEQEAIFLANDTDAGLAAYVYTKDLERSWRVPEALQFGMVGLNTGLISTEVAPFGGVKESGIGREGSSFGIDDYLDLKMTCLSLE
jgi:succinate-semialdehyde dehydrogenase / glutarate-semialdehyde dehydrogenase